MRRARFDELDDLGPPPPQPLIRFCGSSPRCRRRARPGGRHCRPCHAAAVRRWRNAHRREINVRRRDAAATRDADARARDSARAKLAMALQRGTIKRGRCRFCASSDTIGLIADPARWRDVVWVCREDRQAELQRRRDSEAARAASEAQATWLDERATVLAAIADLPTPERARLHEIASCGPAGMRLAPEAPLYVMQLVRAYKRHFPTP